ncbi:MAG TPA: hypothetical protein VER58_06900 [Thermoanaerobaculia bacterium]|nr:hypothetical protein [Thermoanaerobaculia bacterium]
MRLRRSGVITVMMLWALTVNAQHRPISSQSPNLERLLTAVQKLVNSYYPKAQVTLDGQVIHFESNTRKFMIHEPLLTGEWQDAREETGPQKSGIYGDVELRSGVYAGQAGVPQTFDKRYFTLLVMAPYDPVHDQHLYVRVKYPYDISHRFLEDFRRLVNQFGRLVFPESGGQQSNSRLPR